jgi:anti-sigma factor RsiW
VSTSGHRRDPHLGGLVAAVVDGALDHEARERALGHLARCDDCRAEVEAQRRLKARLAQLGTPEVPAGLAERLLALPAGAAALRGDDAALRGDDAALRGDDAALRGDDAGLRGGDAALRTGTDGPTRVAELPQLRMAASFRRPDPAAIRGTTRPPARRPAGRSSRRVARRRVAGAAVGGFAAFALSLATVLALGSPEQPDTIVPAVDSYTVEHNRTAVGVPGADPVVELTAVTTAGGR